MTPSPSTPASAVARLREMLTNATPGPWVATGQCIDQYAEHPDGTRLLSGGNAYMDDDYSMFTDTDCAIIVAAVNALPALLDVVEAATTMGTYAGDRLRIKAALARLDEAV